MYVNNLDTTVRSALLSGKEAHLWLVNTADISVEFDNEMLLKLSESEQSRYNSLHIATVKREYLVTRALVRSALSHYADVEPLDWKFESNPYGRPELAPRFSALQLNFNVSHSYGAVACLIARQHQVGLDVEAQNRSAEFDDFLDEVLTPFEQKSLKNKQTKGDTINFLHYWTLKEAYSKAVGCGLSMSFKDIMCLFGQNVELPELDEFIQLQKDNWQLSHVPVLPSHLLAIAIHKATPDDVTIRLIKCMPKVGDMQSGKLVKNPPEYIVPRLYKRI